MDCWQSVFIPDCNGSFGYHLLLFLATIIEQKVWTVNNTWPPEHSSILVWQLKSEASEVDF